jgi:hypothetical protein
VASVADLLGRAEELGAHVVYQGAPPTWLELAAQTARDGVPVIVNVKGIRPDAVPVLVTLAEYERLTRAAAGGAK